MTLITRDELDEDGSFPLPPNGFQTFVAGVDSGPDRKKRQLAARVLWGGDHGPALAQPDSQVPQPNPARPAPDARVCA